MRIQHNIMAMNAYRNYTNNVSAMKGNLEKLSSGYKINRAGDDAAGLAISEKMRAQITGLQTAQKNAKDGISLVQTAEGALTEVHDMLNRMVELATQSANGTYDNSTDRAQLQKEMDQLKTEINRIADSSNFNGIKLLDGSMDGQNIKMTGVKSTLNLSTASNFTIVNDGQLTSKAAAKGKYSIDFSNANVTNNASTQSTGVSITLGGTTVNVTVEAGATLEGADLAEAVRKALDEATGAKDDNQVVLNNTTFNLSVQGDKLVLEMDEVPTTQFTTNMAGQLTFTASSVALVGNAAEQFKVTPEVEATTASGRAYGQVSINMDANIVKDGNAIKIGDETYIFATKQSTLEKFSGGNVIDLTDQGSTISMNIAAQRLATAASGNSRFKVGSDVSTASVSITEKEGGVDYSVNNLAGTDGLARVNGMSAANDATAANWKGLIEYGTATLTGGGKALTLQIGDTAEDYNQLKVNIKDIHTNSLGLNGVSIADQASAQSAVDAIKKAINYVSDIRGTLGATQNRLDHTINNLSVMTENIQDAESTIRDVDVAEEMMAYTKNNILIQSAQAMLAQANQVPQGVLQLLG